MMANSQAGGFNAYSVSIWWKEADFATTSAFSTSPSLISSAILSSWPTASAAAATVQQLLTPPHLLGYREGVNADISVGVAIAALAILGVLFMLFSRCRRQRISHNGAVESCCVEHEEKDPYIGKYSLRRWTLKALLN